MKKLWLAQRVIPLKMSATQMKFHSCLLTGPTLACAFLLACSSSKPKPLVTGAASRPAQIQRAKVSLEEIRRDAAEVEVLNMKPVPLVVGEGKKAWVRVPEQFIRYQTLIFSITGPVNGVADYKVTKGGYLVVACNYDYQGNDSGDWKADRWTRAQFQAAGWRELVAEDLGGVLVAGENRQQVVFVKKVAAGTTGRLRCNKYSPPYFILCSDKKAVAQTVKP